MTSEVVLKTAVNTRSSLESRLPKTSKEPQAPGSYALHHALETTYDIDYTAMPLNKMVDKSNRFSVTQINGTASSEVSFSHGHPSFATCGSGVGGITQFHYAAARKQRQSGVSWNGEAAQLRDRTTTLAESQGDEVNGGGASKRDDAGYSVMSHPSSEWESEAHAATRNVEPVQRTDFYSTVRKVERVDDDQRGGLVGSVQRAVDIRTKRGCHPVMQPPEREYQQAEPVEMPLVAAQEKRLVQRNYLDLVECSHLDPDSEQQYGFNDAPTTRLPGADLSQNLTTQSKAITRMGTSENMFRGYPKYLDDKVIGYAGHIPQHDRNLSAIHHTDDVRRTYAKSFMTLAEHGGGVDTAVASGNFRAQHRAGKRAPAAKILKPKSDAQIRETMEGRMLMAPHHDTLPRERAMNIRDDNQGKNYF